MPPSPVSTAPTPQPALLIPTADLPAALANLTLLDPAPRPTLSTAAPSAHQDGAGAQAVRAIESHIAALEAGAAAGTLAPEEQAQLALVPGLRAKIGLYHDLGWRTAAEVQRNKELRAQRDALLAEQARARALLEPDRARSESALRVYGGEAREAGGGKDGGEGA